MRLKSHFVTSILLTGLLNIYSETAGATTPIRFLNIQHVNNSISIDKVRKNITKHFHIDEYKQVKAQLIYNLKSQPDHFILYFLHKNNHGLTIARMNVDRQYHLISIENNYILTTEDFAQQPGKKLTEAKCQDPTVEFVAFAPVDDELEQEVTIDVANAAKTHGLNTVSLLLNDATRDNYFNYLVCPELKGNFYDGNATPYMILTADGVILTQEIKTILADKFRYKVTNIWVAGAAFEDPLESAMIDIAKSQKYIAGINALTIGSGDKTAACAMKAAMNGDEITASFNDCYKQHGTELDEWGIGGYGSEYFGQ